MLFFCGVQHQWCPKNLAGKVLFDIGRRDFKYGSYLKSNGLTRLVLDQ